jgi:nucleoid DNA-binding protein
MSDQELIEFSKILEAEMTNEELIAQLRNSKGWPTLGNAAADRIEALIERLNTVLEREAATTAHMFGKLEVLTEQLEAARAEAKEGEAVDIDIRHVMMDEIEKAAAESPWVPAEYYMNEIVSDICDFLRSPR